MKFFIKKILFPTLIFIFIFLFTLNHIKEYNKNKTQNYTLKAYKNTVALYNGVEIVKIYNNIILNTLPEKDIYQFKSGIAITSPEEAEIYLEDFDN